MPTLKEWKTDMLISEIMVLSEAALSDVDSNRIEEIVRTIHSRCLAHMESVRQKRDNN